MSEIFGMKKIAGLCLTWVARTVFALIYGLVFFSADAVYNMIVFKRVAVDHTFFIIAVYYYLGAFFIFWAISAFSATVYRVLLGEENISKELAAWWEIYSVVLFASLAALFTWSVRTSVSTGMSAAPFLFGAVLLILWALSGKRMYLADLHGEYRLPFLASWLVFLGLALRSWSAPGNPALMKILLTGSLPALILFLFFIGFRKFSGFSTAKTFVFISVILVVLLWGWSAALQRGFSTGPGEAVPFFLLGPDVG